MGTKSQNESGFFFKDVHKSIEISPNGHGIAQYEFVVLRSDSKKRFIRHEIEMTEESIPRTVTVPSLKAGFDAWQTKSFKEIIQGYTFAIGSLHNRPKKLIWREMSGKRQSLEFEIDLNMTFGTATELFKYGYGWSFPDMFQVRSKANELKSSFRITYPTQRLTLTVKFEENYPLKRGPDLIALDEKGSEQRCGATYQFLNLLGTSFDMRMDHILGEFYEARIDCPRVGWTYQTAWKIT